jgi:hypothetical protein
MKSWARRLLSFFRAPSVGAAAAPPAVLRQTLPPCPPTGVTPVVLVRPLLPLEAPAIAKLEPEFFAWLWRGDLAADRNTAAQHGLDADTSLAPEAELALAKLDALIADPKAHARLLPRTAAVLPQLLARLRDPATTLPTLVAHISRDVSLVAEVVRMANGALYRRDDAVVELAHAIQLLGTEGLRVAIARAVLQPLISVRGDACLTPRLQRLWVHADKKAQLCAALAKADGSEPFDAYLLGLMHDAAWSAVLRGLAGAPGVATWRPSHGLFAAVTLRRDRLFAAIAAHWQLADQGLELARAVGHEGLRQVKSKPAWWLTRADDLASLLCLRSSSTAFTATRDSLLNDSVLSVQALFAALQDAHKSTASA